VVIITAVFILFFLPEALSAINVEENYALWGDFQFSHFFCVSHEGFRFGLLNT
jgi:hypothetical protein